MSAATIEAVRPTQRTGDRGAIPVPPQRIGRRRRPARGSARSVAPTARSTAGVSAPRLRTARGRGDVSVQACQGAAPAVVAPATVRGVAAAGWRLTNRGIAVVMVTGGVLLAAAVTVIAATAITVTSADYVQPGHSAIAGR